VTIICRSEGPAPSVPAICAGSADYHDFDELVPIGAADASSGWPVMQTPQPDESGPRLTKAFDFA